VKNNAHVRFNEPPAYSREICIDCAKCLVVCADPGAIQWADGKMVGIDLTYCKGCMRCVSVCPETKKGKALMNPALQEVEA
jgi:pyruvate ferredoxin oxidoreductase gamma subunit